MFAAAVMIKNRFVWPNIDRVTATFRLISVKNREGIYLCTVYN